MDREAWRAVVHGLAKSQTGLSNCITTRKKLQVGGKFKFKDQCHSHAIHFLLLLHVTWSQLLPWEVAPSGWELFSASLPLLDCNSPPGSSVHEISQTRILERQPTAAFLPGESHGQRSLVGHSPWGHRESDATEGLMHTHTPPSAHSPPAPGDPMMLKRTLLHASMPGNLVLNERISCLFKDTTQPAAEPPREGPPGSTCSLCALPHGEDPGGGWGRQDRPHQPSCASFLILPGTTADTSSRHSQLHGRWFLQGRRGANHRSGRVYSCLLGGRDGTAGLAASLPSGSLGGGLSGGQDGEGSWGHQILHARGVRLKNCFLFLTRITFLLSFSPSLVSDSLRPHGL